jgi:hypothetical protein
MNSPRLNWPGRLPRLLWFRRQCPLCTSIEFEAAELLPLDRPLTVLALYPFRCVNCWLAGDDTTGLQEAAELRYEAIGSKFRLCFSSVRKAERRKTRYRFEIISGRWE